MFAIGESKIERKAEVPFVGIASGEFLPRLPTQNQASTRLNSADINWIKYLQIIRSIDRVIIE
jgi:hypothetical protein